jgi:WhiB family transcriptional regulator, redox-sensing transcriptional regulator
MRRLAVGWRRSRETAHIGRDGLSASIAPDPGGDHPSHWRHPNFPNHGVVAIRRCAPAGCRLRSCREKGPVTGAGSPIPAPDNQRKVTRPGETRAASRTWMSYGACHGTNTELFFPVAGRALEQVDSAKAVCGRCNVSVDCLSYALATTQHGIWGGTTGDERAAMRTVGRRELNPVARRGDAPCGAREPGSPGWWSALSRRRATGPA